MLLLRLNAMLLLAVHILISMEEGHVPPWCGNVSHSGTILMYMEEAFEELIPS